MGRRKSKKGRAAKNNTQSGESTEPEELRRAPHSFIFTRGRVGGCLKKLMKDFRTVMEPFTAASLKASKKNKLKDFVSVAGPLNVTHLGVFTQTDIGVYFRVARLPRGPTMTMKVHGYSLTRDVISSLKRPVMGGKLFTNSPLVVLNSFNSQSKPLKLLSSTFQNMFPKISLTKVKLCSLKRCVLLSYNPETKLIDFRHYAIRAVPVGLSRGVKKLVQAKVPDLSRFSDISEYLTRSGQLSESEVEDDPQSHVELPQDLSSRGNRAASQSAIRLVELGPRMTLQLVKVEEDLMSGSVMFHEFIHKSEEEKQALQKKKSDKVKLKQQRRKEQEQNVNRKHVERLAHKQRSLQGAAKEENVEEHHDDDAEWFRQEVGKEPEKDLFSSGSASKRKMSPNPNFKKRKAVMAGEAEHSGGKKRKFESEGFAHQRDKFPSRRAYKNNSDKTSPRSSDKGLGRKNPHASRKGKIQNPSGSKFQRGFKMHKTKSAKGGAKH